MKFFQIKKVLKSKLDDSYKVLWIWNFIRFSSDLVYEKSIKFNYELEKFLIKMFD